MPRKIRSVCEECSKDCKTRRGGWRFKHWFCGRCLRRKSFPKLFKKLYGEIQPQKKKDWKKRRRYRFKREEELILYHKHKKEMSLTEYKSHINKMKGIVAIVHSIEKKNKKENKPKFQDAFAELAARGVPSQ